MFKVIFVVISFIICTFGLTLTKSLRRFDNTKLYVTPSAHSSTFTKFKNSIIETDSFTLEELEELEGYILQSIRRKNEKRNLILKEQPLHDLCEISKEACEIVTPMLQAFYAKISGPVNAMGSDYFTDLTAKLKADATYFSIADGVLQHMFVDFLFAGDKFAKIVGEEDDTKVNLLTTPYTVDELVVPEEFNSLVESTLKKIISLGQKIDGRAYKHLTAFVDPIDGTREFATGKGDAVSILLGYNDPTGHPVAGIIYRPLTMPVTWAAGAASENCIMGHLDRSRQNPKGMLVTDGKVSKFLSSLIDEMGFEKVPSLASGNRALMLIEGKAGAYIRDTGGFAKWDTSGPQAVLEAYGGVMAKLPPFLSDKTLESYTHLKSSTNLDFEPGIVQLTKSNAVNKSDVKKDIVTITKQGSSIITTTSNVVTIVDDLALVKPYSCLAGLVALNKQGMTDENIDRIHNSMIKVSVDHPPTYT